MSDSFRERQTYRLVLLEDFEGTLHRPHLFGVHQHTVSAALSLATSQPTLFADVFGEPMPSHLASALALELDLWRSVRTTLEQAEHAGSLRRKRLLARLQALIDKVRALLDLEDRILTSPLVHTFEHELRALGGAR